MPSLGTLLAQGGQSRSSFFGGGSKPYVRWWWLSGPFNREDMTSQLKWVRDAGFGGVELAWIYPRWIEEEGDDTARPAWLSQDWQDLIAFVKSEADSLGLGCDFTFGSCWPFGGSWVGPGEAVQTFGGLSDQRIGCSWESPVSGPPPVVNHLSAKALAHYAQPLLAVLQRPLTGRPSALFCDSLELDTEDMWSEPLWNDFQTEFGYDLHPFVDDLDEHVDVRYDYRKLIAQTIRREFYESFTSLCQEHNAYSRVQCHGAPTDLLQAYAAVDVPESEALLFLPSFSRIAASAAAWTGKPIVSAETFTCIYGFPGWDSGAEEYWKREKLGDLKLLADALFAHGVNQIVWHGMPYQAAGKEVEFYASVHVGPDSPLAFDLRSFNAYLEHVSGLLRLGKTYAGVGIYLPFEDALMLGHIPEEDQTPGANFVWEMRYALPSPELEGYHPLWISVGFLKEARVADGLVCSRDLRLQALYVDAEWMDGEAVAELARLAGDGAIIICKRQPREPGRNKTAAYAAHLEQIVKNPNTYSGLDEISPLLSGEDIPQYWARVLDEDLLIFFANPTAKQIRYPMPYNLSAQSVPAQRQLRLHWKGNKVPVTLNFAGGQSLLLLASKNGAIEIAPSG